MSGVSDFGPSQNSQNPADFLKNCVLTPNDSDTKAQGENLGKWVSRCDRRRSIRFVNPPNCFSPLQEKDDAAGGQRIRHSTTGLRVRKSPL